MIIMNYIALTETETVFPIYIGEDIPSKPIANHMLPDDIEGEI